MTAWLLDTALRAPPRRHPARHLMTGDDGTVCARAWLLAGADSTKNFYISSVALSSFIASSTGAEHGDEPEKCRHDFQSGIFPASAL